MEMHSLERRRNLRVPIYAGAFAMVKKPSLLGLWIPRLVKLGPIVDISLGGLAIHYIENNIRSQQYPTVAMMFPGDQIAFTNLAIRTVSDRRIAQLARSAVIRRRAFQFQDLSESQTSRLNVLIRQLAAADFPDVGKFTISLGFSV